MPATRHAWIQESHNPNPFGRSLTRPITLYDSKDLDVEWTPPGAAQPETLACSVHEFSFPYRNFRKDERVGRGRICLPPTAEANPGPRSVPLVLSIHYEMGPSVPLFLAQGWAVMTPFSLSEDHGFNLVGDGMDHTLAMAELARRLPWVDYHRICWTGGSAGGYQCLMTMEALWPVACAIADVPISDVTYNLACIDMSGKFNAGITDPAGLVIPVCRAVHPIVAGTNGGLGGDVDNGWRNSAPMGAPLIRSPLLIHSATGDLLCPMPQIGSEFVRTPKRGVFPPGWTYAYEKLANPNALDKPLNEWIPREDLETICVSVPKDAPRVGRLPVPPDAPPAPPIEPLMFPSKPYSRSKLVTILIQDEGAPDPLCTHTKYAISMDPLPYIRYHFGCGYVPAEHLNPLLLTRLLGRFSEKVPQNPTLPPIRRLHPDFDKWETLLALESYLGTPVRRENLDLLARMYGELPPVARGLDVEKDGKSASFAADPVAGILWHKAVVLRRAGDTAEADCVEAELTGNHAGSAWADVPTIET